MIFKKILNTKIIFFIFRYRFRQLALNNLCKNKRLGKYYIVNLSGIYLSWIGFLLYKLNFSNNFKFISCDGWPFLSNQKNSINIWLGGTKLKISNKFENLNNNYVTASTIFTPTDKLIQFYPCNVINVEKFDNQKIVIAMNTRSVDDEISMNIWNQNKNNILKNFSILENNKFWEINEIKDLDIYKKHKIYMNIKSLLRLELLKLIKKNFKEKCILIGDDIKNIYPEALNSNYKKGFLKDFYKGNICVDFLAKDGEQALYPSSIEILENGGILAQVRTIHSPQLFEMHEKDLIFNDTKKMLEILSKLLKNKNLDKINKFFQLKFNNDKYNENTLNKVFK